MCREIRHYPPPNKTMTSYVKPVPIITNKPEKADEGNNVLLTEVSTDNIKST